MNPAVCRFVPMSTALFPSITATGAVRRLEALCADSCVAVSSGTAGTCRLPEIQAESRPDGFKVTVGSLNSRALTLECMPQAATWLGQPQEMSLWIVDASNRLHSCVRPENKPRSESLASNDRVVAVSKGLVHGLESVEMTIEMALCDDPSLTTACSWILDAADDLHLAGPHIVAAWRAP